MHTRGFSLVVFFLGISSQLLAQTTSVSGRIFDGETGEPLPFVTVSLVGTNVGTMTDTDGHYSISTDEKVSRIFASFLGYQAQTIQIQKQVAQKLDIALEPKRIELAVAEVRPEKGRKKNPAKPLMQRVVDAKKQNNPERIPALKYKYHERLEIDVNDIPEMMPSRKIWGKFAWVWDYMDSAEARVNLPLFFTETAGTQWSQSNPRRQQKVIEAARATWLEDGESTSSVTSEFLDINLYENQMLLLDKGFISPLHDRGLLHYRYHILDTLEVEGRTNFHIGFVPRRRGELLFEGELWIDTLTLGLKHVEAKISEGANINFVRSFRWEQNYILIGDNWVVNKEQQIADISMTGGSMGMYARSTNVYHDFEIAESWSDSVWTTRSDITFKKGSNDVMDSQWKQIRPQAINQRESDIYFMADSVESMPQYKFLKSFLYGLGSGYVQTKNLEFGPWYDSYSRNAVEGHRFALGLQTSNEFSRTFMPSVFVAYGTEDKAFKYGADVVWVQRKTPRIEWNVSHSSDIEQLGMMGFFDQGNVFNSALNLEGDQNQLALITNSEINFLAENGTGLSTFVELRHRKVQPKGVLEFPDPDNPEGSSDLITAESTLRLRYARNEKFVSGAIQRKSLGSRWPVITATTTQGWKGVAGSMYRYGRYTLGVNGKLRMGPLGRIEWNAEGGTYTGLAPFPLLELQPANETALSIQQSFNLLRYFEYVTDEWVRGGAEWHGEGLVLGRLPLIKRLELREVIGIKAVYGSWDTRHEALVELPETTKGLNGTYAEAVFGVENIFQFLRLDVHYRITESLEGMRDNWGVRVGMGVEF